MRLFYACLLTLVGFFGLAAPVFGYENVTSSTPYTLGTTVSGSFAGASNTLANYYTTYAGYGSVQNGLERVYSFTLAKPGFLSLDVGDNQAYAIYVLQGTNTASWQPLKASNSGYRLRFDAGTHYIVVEQSGAAATGTFSFNISFKRSAYLDYFPFSPQRIACGQNVTVDFASANGYTDGYSHYKAGAGTDVNSDYVNEPGPDRQYKFTLTTGKYVLLRPLTVQHPFHLYLLADSSNGLAMYSQDEGGYTYRPYGPTDASDAQPFFYNTYLPAGTYYISAELNNVYGAPYLDGTTYYHNASNTAPYTFTFQCADAPYPPYQDLSITNTFTPGQLLQGNLSGAPNSAYNYGVNYEPQCGPERNYAYNLPTASLFRVKPMHGAEGNVRLIPLGTTTSSGNAGQGSSTLTDYKNGFSVIQGPGTWYLSVEQGSATATTNYSIQTQAYCIPTASASSTLTTLTSGNCNGAYLFSENNSYGFYDDLTTPKTANQYFLPPLIRLDSANALTWQANAAGWHQLYIDFNNDGDFADAYEQVYAGSGATTSVNVNLVFSSSNAAYAAARGKQVMMRLRVSPENLAGQPCGAGSGITRDYAVYINAYMPPVITGYNPTHAPVGGSTIISGHNFKGVRRVIFGGGVSSYSQIYYNYSNGKEDTLLAVYNIPSGAKTGPIIVETIYGRDTGAVFTIDATPVITSATQNACSGDTIIVKGRGFLGSTSMSSYYQYVPSSYTYLGFRVVNDSVIRACVPIDAANANKTQTLSITKNGSYTPGIDFIFKPGITIGSLSQGVGYSGAQGTGTTFWASGYTTASANAPVVQFSQVNAQISSFTTYSYALYGIRFNFPTGGGTAPITVNNGYCTASGPTVTILPRATATPTVWVRQGGGTSTDRFSRVRTDVYGNVYAAGSFSYTATFDGVGGSTSSTLTASSAGGLDGVLTRYNKKGQLQWLVRFAGAAGNDEALGLATDKFGYAYVCGYFTGAMTIYPGSGSATKTLTSAGGQDMFVAKIKADGTIVYAFRMGDTGNDQATGIDVAPDLRFYVSGWFIGNTAITGVGGTVVPLTSRGNADAFLAKFSDIGTLYWAIQGGGAGNDFGYGAAADIDGGGYLLGSFEGNAKFNSQPTAGVSVTDNAVGGSDGFILAVTQQGGIRWFRSYGGTTNENVRDLAPDPLGNGVAAVGGFSQTADFDGYSTSSTASTTLTARGFYDAFAIRVNKQGVTQWVSKAGGYGQDQALAVRMARNGSVKVGLTFQQTARNFGSTTDDLTSNSDYGYGYGDGLLVQLDAATGVASPSFVQIITIGSDYVSAVDTADGDGIIGAGYYGGTLAHSDNLILGNRTLVSTGDADAWLARFGPTTSGSVRLGVDGTSIQSNSKLLAYPNPAAGSITLTLQGAEDGPHTATLYSADGKEAAIQMLDGSALSAGATLKLPAVPGLYLLRLAGPDGVRSVRVTVR